MRYKLWWCSCFGLKIEGQYSPCLQEGRNGGKRKLSPVLLTIWCLFVLSSIGWLCLLATLGFLTLLCQESSMYLNVDQQRLLTKRRVEQNGDFIVSFEPFAWGLGQNDEVVNHVLPSRQRSLKAYMISSVVVLLSKDKRKLFSPLCQMCSRNNPGALWVFLASLIETVLNTRLGLRIGNHSRHDNFRTFGETNSPFFLHSGNYIQLTLNTSWNRLRAHARPTYVPLLWTKPYYKLALCSSCRKLSTCTGRTGQTKCLWGFFTFLTKDEGYS